MQGPNSNSNRRFFRTDQRKGQAPSAAEARKIGEALNKLTGAPRPPTKNYSRVRLVRMAQPMGTLANESKESRAERLAKLQYWDKDERELVEKTGNADKTTCCDPFGLVYDTGEALAMLYLEQAGVHVPLNPRTVRHAITWPETRSEASSESEDGACNGVAGAEYPQQGSRSTVYPIKFVRLEYEELAGRREASLSYLNDALCHDAYIFNLVDDVFLPPYSIIQVYSVTGKDGKPQWFTATYYGSDESSSSSGSISESSASHSSQSESSPSASSRSAQSSASSASSVSASSRSLSSLSVSVSSASASSNQSSASSNGSSASSNLSSASSRGSSASSDTSSGGSSASSERSSGGSSPSSGGSSASSVTESDGFDCATFVSSMSFNPDSCILTYCTTRVCFPAGLGITVDNEVC